MRKKLMIALVTVLFVSITPQKVQADLLVVNSHTMKQVTLIAASLGITVGGTYLISKTSKGILNKVCSLVGGSVMIATGFAGIVFSDLLMEKLQDMFTDVVEPEY